MADGFTGEDRDLFLALLRAGRQFLITTPSGRPADHRRLPLVRELGTGHPDRPPRPRLLHRPYHGRDRILTEIGSHEREGLLPNFFSADGAPEAYNTVDSSLLYFRAVQELLRITGDIDLIRSRFWPVMKRIINRFLAGTRFGIGIDARGLLHAGEEGNGPHLDGRRPWGEVPVTPRHGYAVEINALWYNALCFTRELRDGIRRSGMVLRRPDFPAPPVVPGDLLDPGERLPRRCLSLRHSRPRRPAESALCRLPPLLAARSRRAGRRRPDRAGAAPHPLRPPHPLARRSGLPGPLPG